MALLWLWCGLIAVAPIRSLAWESPYIAGAALKRQKVVKRRKKKKKKERKTKLSYFCRAVGLGNSSPILNRGLGSLI